MPKTGQAVIIAYIPVIHRGYYQLFSAHSEAKHLYIVDPKPLKQQDYLRKDLRALKPAQIKSLLSKAGLFESVQILDNNNLLELDIASNTVIMPEDDVSNELKDLFKKAKIILFPIFLRWDRRSIEETNQTNQKISVSRNNFDKKLMQQALNIATNSTDIWRRVGAILVDKNKKIISKAHNLGESHQSSPWMEGDPRNVLSKGLGIETSVFTHAESKIIAEAAKTGTAIKGCALYVSDFPCPVCAKLIAHSGIAKLYFLNDYAVLDGERILKDYGVKLYRVAGNFKIPDHPATWVKYKKSS